MATNNDVLRSFDKLGLDTNTFGGLGIEQKNAGVAGVDHDSRETRVDKYCDDEEVESACAEVAVLERIGRDDVVHLFVGE